MYETHWGLDVSPFRGLADPRFFYCSPTHDEALARLTFLVENRRRLGLLLGEPGSGKTLVLKVLSTTAGQPPLPGRAGQLVVLGRTEHVVGAGYATAS